MSYNDSPRAKVTRNLAGKGRCHQQWNRKRRDKMASEIDVPSLKVAVNVVLDHLFEDLGIRTLALEEDLYWDCPVPELYDMSKTPIGLVVGSLRDDAGSVADRAEI